MRLGRWERICKGGWVGAATKEDGDKARSAPEVNLKKSGRSSSTVSKAMIGPIQWELRLSTWTSMEKLLMALTRIVWQTFA